MVPLFSSAGPRLLSDFPIICFKIWFNSKAICNWARFAICVWHYEESSKFNLLSNINWRLIDNFHLTLGIRNKLEEPVSVPSNGNIDTTISSQIDWIRVSSTVGSRSPHQCLHKWNYSLSRDIHHPKRNWTICDDFILINSILDQSIKDEYDIDFIKVLRDYNWPKGILQELYTQSRCSYFRCSFLFSTRKLLIWKLLIKSKCVFQLKYFELLAVDL